MRSVKGASATASEPRNISPSPWPMASGLPRRAAIIRSASPSNRKARAKAPCNRPSVARAASTGPRPWLMCQAVSRATVSVSVCDSGCIPRAITSSRSARKFSMMPLWTTATGPRRWGWALASVAAPWVAQRVWPMPACPVSGSCTSRSDRLISLPTARRRSSRPEASTVATPALS